VDRDFLLCEAKLPLRKRTKGKISGRGGESKVGKGGVTLKKAKLLPFKEHLSYVTLGQSKELRIGSDTRNEKLEKGGGKELGGDGNFFRPGIRVIKPDLALKNIGLKSNRKSGGGRNCFTLKKEDPRGRKSEGRERLIG